MKKSLFYPVFVLFLFLFVPSASSEELIRIEGKDVLTIVDKDEFIRVYKKNHSVHDKRSINEYLELYTNFLLKVTEAKSLGFDTLREFQAEFSNYRQQLAAPYMRDDEYRDELINSLHEMMQEDRRVSHIMLRVDFDQSLPEDTLVAYNKMENIRKDIRDGKLTFEEAAKLYSDDKQSGQKGGDMGWVNLFKYPYVFEKAVHQLDIDEISAPVKTRFGYHLIHVTDIRDAVGEIKVAHIIKMIPPDISKEEQDSIKQIIDEIHARLEQGEDFAELASKYSDDERSGRSGGELPWFGAGQMISEFETEAFSLKNNGDYSEPFRSIFGWHIVKRLNKKPPKSYENAKMQIENKLKGQEYSVILKKAFLNKLKDEYGGQVHKKNISSFYNIDDAYFSNEDAISLQYVNNKNDVLFSFADTVLYSKDFSLYLDQMKSKKQQMKLPIRNFVDRMFIRYIDEVLLDYERKNLSRKYPEYSYLVQEYYDGILLFNIMEEKVWSKAIKDSTGLLSFYEDRKEQYIWGERLLTEVYRFTNQKEAEDFYKLLKKRDKKGITSDELIRQFEKKHNEHSMTMDNVKYNKEDDMISLISWEPGISKVLKKDGNYYVLRALEVLDPQPKKIEEVKGLLVSEYQDYLEKQWLQKLREKYSIEINRQALSAMINEL